MSPSITSSPAIELSQLPFLIRLLDDPSPAVRQRVTSRLREMALYVWPEIERLALPITTSQRVTLQAILAPAIARTQQTPESFLEWLTLPTENEKLEAAYGWLSCLRWGPDIGVGMHEALDSLAREYLEFSNSSTPTPQDLSGFLFRHKGMNGVDGQDFYEPENSDLMTVIETGRGIPISLASVFILVGWRLGLNIVGCNFPGHFLARAPLNGPPTSGISFLHGGFETDQVFDCHNGGRVLAPEEIAALRRTAEFELRNAATAATMMDRVLYNLATSHHILGERDRTIYFLNLRKQLEEAARKLMRR